MQKAKKEKTDIYQVTNRRKQKRRDEYWKKKKKELIYKLAH